MKKIITLAMAAITAVLMTSCDSTFVGLEVKPNDKLTLNIEIEDVTATTAKVKVTHDGQASDSWYGLLTTSVNENEEQLITEAAAQFVANGTGEGLHKSKNYVSILKNLEPQTAYKYIAFGLTAEGKVYGNSASYEFITEAQDTPGGNEPDDPNVDPEDPVVGSMRVNSAWKVRYKGAGVLYEQNYDHVVEVKSTDNNPYIVTVVYASEWNPIYLPELGEALIVDMKEYLAEFNKSNGTNYTLNDMLYRGDAADAFDLYPGYYKAVALGVTADGRLSNLYAVSDTFEVKEPVATDAFKAWLGNWTVVGSNSLNCELTITTHVANRSVWVLGWSGVSDWSINVDYNRDRDDLTFYSQLVAQNFDFGTYGVGDVYFLAGDDEGYFYQMNSSGYGIAIAGILDDGTRAIVQYGVGVTDYPSFDKMFFMAKIGNDFFDISMDASPIFPCIMAPHEQSSPASLSVGKSYIGSRYTSLRKPATKFVLTPRKDVPRFFQK
jgi:hypothetical protein